MAALGLLRGHGIGYAASIMGAGWLAINDILQVHMERKHSR
jgi:hypothetical protein